MIKTDILISPATIPARPKLPRSRLYARIAMIAGAVITVITAILFIGFAAYPLFTGQGLREFFISLIVPFLISLMGIVPGLLLYFTGRNVARFGPGYGAAVIAFVLSLPWLAGGIAVLPRLGVTNISMRIAVTLIGLVLLTWAISVFLEARSATRK